jgi:predicted dehydrogenase
MKVTRRSFLARSGVAAAALAAPAIFPRGVLGANERIVMGQIGCGGQGRGDMGALKGSGPVEYAAVCDVYAQNREQARAANGSNCEGYNDFRDLLDRTDLDAVSIATPDHWHALIAIAACEAGKDIYCQKPLALTIEEGRAMVNAVRRYNRVFQTGSQQRSERGFRYACELVRNGRIGKLERIRTAIGGNKEGCEPDSDPPPGLDWNLYLGPAKWVPFNRLRFIWEFRWFYDYSGGNLTDWGAHHNDIAQWALGMDESGPVEIDGKGVFPATGCYDTPLRFEVNYKYANGVQLSCSSEGNGCWFYGTEGEIYVNRGQLSSKPKEIIEKPIDPAKEVALYESSNHYGNFLDCVRTRKRPICDIEVGHRSVSVCHLGNISIRLGRPLRWDPAAEKVVGDEEANRWLSRPMRAPWHL